MGYDFIKQTEDKYLHARDAHEEFHVHPTAPGALEKAKWSSTRLYLEKIGTLISLSSPPTGPTGQCTRFQKRASSPGHCHLDERVLATLQAGVDEGLDWKYLIPPRYHCLTGKYPWSEHSGFNLFTRRG